MTDEQNLLPPASRRKIASAHDIASNDNEAACVHARAASVI